MAERRKRVDVLYGLAYPDSRVRRTASALAAAGYDVRVLAWDREGTKPQRMRDGAILIEHARIRSWSGRGWMQVPFLARAIFRHLRSIRNDRPDVLHVIDLPILAAALAIRHVVGRPLLVYDAFEIYALMEAHKYPPPLLRLIGAAERLLPRFADLVITPGEDRRRYFADRRIDSVVIGNWADPPAELPDRLRTREDLGIPANVFCIVYVGGLERSRDLGSLIRHARQTPQDLILIAGRGEQEPMIAAAAGKLSNVRFVGWVDDPTPLYVAADALYYALSPSHPYADHPAPNTLYAAIAFAVPLLHRGQGEIARVSDILPVGERFDSDDSLAAAVTRLRDPGLNARIREGLQKLQTDFSASRAAEALRAAYAGLGLVSASFDEEPGRD